MNDGLVAELTELLALKRFARKMSYSCVGKSALSGNHLAPRRGRGMEFSEVRHYQAGDEIRHMEWRVTARTGRPHIKVYQEERERPVVLLTDFSPSMYFGTKKAFKSVIAARLSALLAWTAIKQGDKVGALFFSAATHNEFIPRARDAGVLPLMASLSNYTKAHVQNHTKSAVSLSEELLRLRRVTKPGTMLVLISDFYNLDADCEQHLSRLRSQNDIIAYHICDALELSPPQSAVYAMTNGQHAFLLDTSDKAVWNSYQSWWEQQHLTRQLLFKRLQIPYHQVTSENDLSQLVQRTFLRRSHA
jgi:uncharacterized protein (DUF58 family)